MTPTAAAALLQAARVNGVGIASTMLLPSSREEAFAIQDATVAELGAIGGWKVGAQSSTAEPICAPLPAAGLMPCDAFLSGRVWQLRGIEVELAFRVGRDLDIDDTTTPAELRSAFDAVMPVIEVVETRLIDWKASQPLAKLADLQSHGALILGAASACDISSLDLRTIDAELYFDERLVKSTHGGNPGADVWRMLDWLARHCVRRGLPLRRGQVVTTGSCTGMQFAPQVGTVRGKIAGVGTVACHFDS